MTPTLKELGWRPFFAAELAGFDQPGLQPARVMAVHRGHVQVLGEGLDRMIATSARKTDPEARPTVGDWVLVDPGPGLIAGLLSRQSLFKRRAPGEGRQVQLIGANIDTVFIVTSCNLDFNIARLERYLVLAREAGVLPVIVLTKADLCEAPEDYARQAQALQPGLLVEILDARDAQSAACLAPFCGVGQTVALLGSSGVGKSTLVNTLTGQAAIATQAIREDDAKGRHTTTARAMHRIGQGGWLLDTPGMRELQLADAATGLAEVFDDIEALAQACRFSDCAHAGEPGCAVAAAVEEGRLAPDRLARWQKLRAEERHNTQSLAERRKGDRAFGKMVRAAMKEKHRR